MIWVILRTQDKRSVVMRTGVLAWAITWLCASALGPQDRLFEGQC